MSSKELSAHEKEVLELGIKFCPYPSSVNYFQCTKDMRAFNRRMRLKEFFADSEDRENQNPPWMKNPKVSNFTPPKNRETNLDSYLDLVNSDTLKLLKTNNDEDWHNLTESQRQALEKLRKNKDLTIKSADKGGALTVMDTSGYNEAIVDMLGDKRFYKEVEEDLNPVFERDVDKIVSTMQCLGYVSIQEAEYLAPRNSRTPDFYGLPKVHKKFKDIPPFRPIVSGCDSCCEKISNLVDFHLQPLTRLNESYVKDTTDFVRKIKDVGCDESAILVSADVSALYTVIDHEEGVEACCERLDDRSEDEKRKMPTEYIKELLYTILKSNCFKFLDKYYHQITGTAMGTPMAPGYANTFMAKIERELLRQYELETGLKPVIWLRFLDDVFFLWTHGDAELKKFMDFMNCFGEKNGMRTDLKFTFESGKSVPFLDTMVSINGNSLKTTLYSKETDAHLYLRKSSCHPPSCTKGIVKGELLRVRRICTLDEDFKKSAQKIMGYFSERGFKKEEMVSTYNEVLGMERDSVLEYKNRKKSERVPYVITFHPRLRSLGSVMRRHFYLLQTNDRLRKVFEEPPMIAFRRLKNLKDLLVRSSPSKGEREEQEVAKCKATRCKCCSHLQEMSKFSIKDKEHNVRFGGTCKSTNLIYGGRCSKCDQWYVGETSMKLHERLNQHRYSTAKVKRGGLLDKSNDTGLAEHFAQDDHNFDEDLELYIFEKGKWKTPMERKLKESYYICRHSTQEPDGMNKNAGLLGDLYEKVNGKI